MQSLLWKYFLSDFPTPNCCECNAIQRHDVIPQLTIYTVAAAGTSLVKTERKVVMGILSEFYYSQILSNRFRRKFSQLGELRGKLMQILEKYEASFIVIFSRFSIGPYHLTSFSALTSLGTTIELGCRKSPRKTNSQCLAKCEQLSNIYLPPRKVY